MLHRDAERCSENKINASSTSVWPLDVSVPTEMLPHWHRFHCPQTTSGQAATLPSMPHLLASPIHPRTHPTRAAPAPTPISHHTVNGGAVKVTGAIKKINSSFHSAKLSAHANTWGPTRDRSTRVSTRQNSLATSLSARKTR